MSRRAFVGRRQTKRAGRRAAEPRSDPSALPDDVVCVCVRKGKLHCSEHGKEKKNFLFPVTAVMCTRRAPMLADAS